MKKIESVLQIKGGMAVVSAEDLAVLLGRKHLSIIRAIDAIPAEYLTKDMFFVADGEVLLSQSGICMIDVSSRHLRMRRRIMLALSIFDAEYREARWAEFRAATPPRIIIKLFSWLNDAGLNPLALVLFKLICHFKKYNPSKTVNIHKSAKNEQ
ncbi:hypothetical protein [Methylobacter sp.]|uniref:hypothetical protein n=1 Tax=Methylobacter sp. TaxID=2051955 RepID=UPI002487A6D7|nr:hypothetical protein [Methylobacter sp.]MDI1277293.1 hypothetical protein [Methylobacter sp.]MDI1357859.1 hypothetical protein [Methylobacter sp.]